MAKTEKEQTDSVHLRSGMVKIEKEQTDSVHLRTGMVKTEKEQTGIVYRFVQRYSSTTGIIPTG